MDESNNPNVNGNNGMPNPGQDPYASMNPDYDNMNYNAFGQNNTTNNSFNDVDDNQVVNPILNQNLQNNTTDNYADTNMNYSNSNYDNSTMNYQDSYTNSNTNYQDSNYTNSNTNYQNSNYTNSNMNYQNSNYTNSNMNYQNNDYTNSNYQESYNNSNTDYQNNSYSDSSMDYQSNSYSDSGVNYQNNSYSDSSMNYQDNNFVDPNMNYQSNNTQYSDQNYGTDSSNFSDDYNTDFARAWMGNLYDKANQKKFNWCAAIFQEIYLLYRKMYLTGVLFLVLKYLILFLSLFLFTKINLTAFALYGVVTLAFIFAFGFGFYPLYKNFVKNKLNTLKQTTTDNSQLVNMAAQKGGQSVLAVVIYCIGVPVIISIVCGILMSLGILNFGFDFLNNNENQDNSEVQNVVEQDDLYDYQQLEFTEGYAIEYDALTWFLDENDKSLTKGNYKLAYSGQALTNIKQNFGYDMATAAGRSSLLDSLMASFESQAAALNISVQKGSSNFIAGTSLPNVYYSYVDVESAESLSRNYLILLPEDDTLFQFVLTVDDTSIDSMTSAEVVSILTSTARVEVTDTDEGDENIVDVNIVNETIDNNVVDEGQVTGNVVNEVDANVVSENTTNETANVTAPTTNTTTANTVTNSTLGEFLR